MPSVPSMLTSPEDRAKYVAEHYWDKYDFANPCSVISRPEIAEQGFADFINTLNYVSADVSTTSITKMLSSAHKADSVVFDYFVELYDLYLNNPNSPMRNEDKYIVVLNYIISSPMIEDINKVRPRYQLEMAMKNRVGNVANDFKYKLKGNTISSMHRLRADYTLLFFNNPDCAECSRVKEYTTLSPTINRLVSAKELVVLSIYPDEDLTILHNEQFPKSWVNGYDPEQKITNDGVYDLRAIPTLYLLDKDKRVILKDVAIEQVDAWLSEMS